MVRAWHPYLIEVLDDERLLANHSEAHMMMRAIRDVGEGIWPRAWFNNPETQVWAFRPGVLANLHNQTVAEMRRRGYPSGSDHKTPAEFEPVGYEYAALNGIAEIGYKPSWEAWLQRDIADLYVKWSREHRFVAWPPGLIHEEADEYLLGRRSRKTGVPTVQKWPLGTFMLTHMDWFDVVAMRRVDRELGPRENADYDKDRFRAIVLENAVRIMQPVPMKSAPSCRICGRWLEGEWSAASPEDHWTRHRLERQMRQGSCDACLLRECSAIEPGGKVSPGLYTALGIA